MDRILWTDEAVFQTNGRVNRHNCVHWSNGNPHLIIEEELHMPAWLFGLESRPEVSWIRTFSTAMTRLLIISASWKMKFRRNFKHVQISHD